MADGSTSDLTFQVVFTLVVAVRFLLPFAIFRWPLPAIIGCLVVDAVDQTVFQAFGYDPPFYQGYDKAMDVFYLGIAYIATLRNWTSMHAFAASRFLFFYRQIGVVLFELMNVRALLMVFPNTFEYFFIAVEAVRTRWRDTRMGLRGWLAVAAVIWIFIKLPQEYWIHIAQLDFTDALEDHAWFGPVLVVLAGIAAVAFWVFVRPRLPAPDHAWRLTAPDVPDEMQSAHQRAAYVAQHERVWSVASLEKSLLVGLLAVIFASILPSVEVSPVRLILWIGIFVLLNIGGTLALARRGWSSEATLRGFMIRVAVNLALVAAIGAVYPPLLVRHVSFFVVLFCVLVTAYDRYRPVHAFRARQALETAR